MRVGHAPAQFLCRQPVLVTSYATHPGRFAQGMPQPPALPAEVWINRPQPAEKVSSDTAELHILSPTVPKTR